MQLSAKDKELLLIAMDTDIARRTRAIRAENNPRIREIWDDERKLVVALSGRVHNEVAK